MLSRGSTAAEHSGAAACTAGALPLHAMLVLVVGARLMACLPAPPLPAWRRTKCMHLALPPPCTAEPVFGAQRAALPAAWPVLEAAEGAVHGLGAAAAKPQAAARGARSNHLHAPSPKGSSAVPAACVSSRLAHRSANRCTEGHRQQQLMWVVAVSETMVWPR